MLRDGWYRTGDVGRLDADGYLFVLDRSKDMIITGGENVYSTEVEEALYTHPGVPRRPCSGSPTRSGARPSTPSSSPARGPDRGGADRALPPPIAGYKVPKSIEFRADPLPKSGPGKVLKRELARPTGTVNACPEPPRRKRTPDAVSRVAFVAGADTQAGVGPLGAHAALHDLVDLVADGHRDVVAAGQLGAVTAVLTPSATIDISPMSRPACGPGRAARRRGGCGCAG